MLLPWIRYAFFLSVLAFVFWLTNRFVHRRAVATFGLSTARARALAVVLASSIVSVIGARIIDRFIPGVALMRAAAQVGMIVQLGVMIATVLLLPIAFFEKLRALAKRKLQVSSDRQAVGAETEPSEQDSDASADALLPRRDFFVQGASGVALAVGGGSAVYGAIFGRHDYQLAEVPIKLARLPPQLDGFTITQLSDIHLGTFVGEDEMRAALALTADTRPDLIVLTGDLVDHDPRYAEMLGQWARRLGAIAPVAAVPGNHDYYSGIRSIHAALRGAGATVLVNDAVFLRDGKLGRDPRPAPGDKRPGFTLLGVDDVWGGAYGGPGPNLERAVARAHPEAARVALCHNPSTFMKHVASVDLQLSGHTHGGQVNLVVRPADYLLRHGFIEGHYQRGGSQLYVNRGFGTAGPPARVGAPPEVTKLILTV